MPVIVMYLGAVVLILGVFVYLALFCFNKNRYAGKVICLIGIIMIVTGAINLAIKMLK